MRALGRFLFSMCETGPADPRTVAAEKHRKRQGARLDKWMAHSPSVVPRVAYAKLVKTAVPQEHAAQIDLDIGRTFADDKSVDAEQREAMRRVLRAWVVHNPTVGYCQGMSYVAGMLVAHFGCEDMAFKGLICLFTGKELSSLYGSGLVLLHKCLAAFDALMQARLPKVHRHMEDCGVIPPMYVAQWFMTLFTRTFPVSVAGVLLDAIYMEGAPLLVKLAFVVIDTLKEQVLQMNSADEIVNYFKRLQFSHFNARDTKKLTMLLVAKARDTALPADVSEIMLA
mmetsp:Transcript_12439/g.29305  ORF Transcript_12439/g.29305 Transcript_12439/m.29305 type:complete len:283 (-) Transcript_12439:53-901(-)